MPWPAIDPGALRHQITFLSQQIGTDATGFQLLLGAGSSAGYHARELAATRRSG